MANQAGAHRSDLRFAIRISATALLMLMSMGSASARAQETAHFDLLCEILSVTANGQVSDSESIRKHFLARASVPLPPSTTPPDEEFVVVPGGSGAYWDLDSAFTIRYASPLGTIVTGDARLSRLTLIDRREGQGTDALDGDSFEYPIAIGSTLVDGFSFDLRDPDGAALATHDRLPDAIQLSDWVQRECYLDGTNKDSLALVLATGTIRAGGMQRADGGYVVEVPYGDVQGLIAAIEFANLGDPTGTTEVSFTGPPEPFVFSKPYGYSENALPEIRSRIVVRGQATFQRWSFSPDRFRLATVGTGGQLTLSQVSIQDFSTTGNGGAIRVEGEGGLQLSLSRLVGNSSTGYGCDLYVDAGHDEDSPPQRLENNYFQGSCSGARIAHDGGSTVLSGNTIENGAGRTALRAAGPAVEARLNLIVEGAESNAQSAKQPAGKPQALCDEDQGLTSLGYNIATDDSCALDQETDLPNTDPLLSGPDANGIRAPLPGSPAIDIGPAELVVIDNAPALPCGWRDLRGLGRPQDGDGDGAFECDAGPVEWQGAGAIQAGHSGAFFNPLRNGEGEYVEILEDGRAAIYTFSYNPTGDGAAWFIGVGNVMGNSLVTEDMLRPQGTSWGAGFDTAAIDFADWGGMSMVFPGCAAGEPPGNVTFSGNSDFEPLVTAAERLSDIFGCGAGIPPHPNAGLSGSFYDPDRNGEGLVIQYLLDGRVLAIMFSYDPEGRQIWMFGQAMADDKTVSMDVLYPAAFTSWGSGFDPEAWELAGWGSWTLTWTDCDTLRFEYDSDAPGFGSGSREYTRLTRLLGSQCPEF